MMRAHQPGSQPLDIPEAIPNPAIPQPSPAPTPAPKEPVKAPEKILSHLSLSFSSVQFGCGVALRDHAVAALRRTEPNTTRLRAPASFHAPPKGLDHRNKM